MSIRSPHRDVLICAVCGARRNVCVVTAPHRYLCPSCRPEHCSACHKRWHDEAGEYRTCPTCRDAAARKRERETSSARRQTHTWPIGFESPRRIERDFALALARIRQARRLGDPRWYVSPWDQRPDAGSWRDGAEVE